jgi:transmembrane sensor
MTKKDDIWPVIVRYLDNSMIGDDADILEKWLDQSNENRRILHSTDRIWKASSDNTRESIITELNLEKDWDRIASQINSKTPEEKRARILHFSKMRKRQQLVTRMLKAVALILVAVTSAFLTYQYVPHGSAHQEVYEPVFKEIATNNAERANIELGDGSRVMLNAASKLIMPENFSQKKREVELQGQAFFDIRQDRNRPFYIQAGNAIVEVIGTSFDVRSYPEDEDMHVVVREGTVELRRMDDPDNRLIVNEGYMGQVSRHNGRIALEMVEEMKDYFGWMEGRLIFRETPLADVFRQIERWYDVRIKTGLSDEQLRDKKLTADLKTRSVQEVLNVIEMSMDIEVTIDGDKVFVSI